MWPRVFFAVACVYVAAHFRPSDLTGWDEGFYWGQLTSLYYDGDLTLHDDLLANRNDPRTQYRSIANVSASGRLRNTFTVGTALVDGAVAGPVVTALRLLGQPRVGAPLFGVAAALALLKVGLLAVLLQRLLGRMSPSVCRRDLSIAAVLLGTPLALYAFRLYASSHLNSALAATAFALCAWHWLEGPTPLRSLALGLTTGLLALARFQDVALVALLLPGLAHALWVGDAPARRRRVTGAGIAVAAAALVFAAQCVAWHKPFGEWLIMRHGEGYMRWSRPALGAVLFSGYRGLLPWSPVVAFAAAGLGIGAIAASGLRRRFLLGAALAVAFMTYVNACPLDWWGGTSFGSRRFCGLAPFFALGVFECLRRWRIRTGVLLLAAVTAWSAFTLACWDARVHDLSVLFRDRPSPAATAIRNVHIQRELAAQTPGESRRAVREELARRTRCSFRLPDTPAPRRPHARDTAWSLTGVAACLGLAVWLVRQIERDARCRRIAVLGALAYVTAFAALVALFVPSSAAMNPLWRSFLDGRIPGREAVEAGLPAEAVALVEAVREPHHARAHLARANGPPHFPNLTPERVGRLAAELEPPR